MRELEVSKFWFCMVGLTERERENDPFSRLHGDQSKKDRVPNRARAVDT